MRKGILSGCNTRLTAVRQRDGETALLRQKTDHIDMLEQSRTGGGLAADSLYRDSETALSLETTELSAVRSP